MRKLPHQKIAEKCGYVIFGLRRNRVIEYKEKGVNITGECCTRILEILNVTNKEKRLAYFFPQGNALIHKSNVLRLL